MKKVAEEVERKVAKEKTAVAFATEDPEAMASDDGSVSDVDVTDDAELLHSGRKILKVGNGD